MRTINRVKELRVARGHESQREFADFITKQRGCPVSYGTINKLENQTGNPTYELLDALARYFGVSIDYMMGRIDKNYTEDTHVEKKAEDDLPPEAKIAMETFYNKMKALYSKDKETGENS